MDTNYLKFQLNILEVQLSLAGATLSDYDKSQNRVRSADGTWAKSPSAMSDNEKLDAFLEKDRGVWRADSATRQKQISDIAQTLAKADKETQDKILTDLAPALSQLGGDLDGVDIEERKRIVSDLDEKLSKLLPKNQANRLITDLILDIDEFDFDAKWTGIREEATANLEETLAKVSTIKNPTVGDRVKKSFQDTIDQFFPKKPLPQEPSPEEKLRKAEEQEVKDAESAVLNLKKAQEQKAKDAKREALNLKKVQDQAVKDAESALLNLKKEQEKLREDRTQEQKAKIVEREALNLKKIQEGLTPEQKFQKTIQESVQERLRKAQEQKVRDAESALLNLKKAQAQKIEDAKREALNSEKAEAQKIKNAESAALNLRKAEERKIKDAERDAQNKEESLVRQKQAREQLKQIGQNTKKLFDDIATMTVAGFKASTKKLTEAEIGEKLDVLTQNVQKAVVDFFKNNIEAYYERRSEKGKAQQVVVRDILNRAKKKAEFNRSLDRSSNKLSGNSDNVVA